MYLWVNVADLDSMGKVGTLGTPLMFMIRPEMGDNLLPGAVYKSSRLDDIFVIIECADERAQAIKDAIEVLAKARIKRKIRTRITEKPPNGKWIPVKGEKCLQP